CFNDRGVEAGCERIQKELKNYKNCSATKGEYYDFSKWKREKETEFLKEENTKLNKENKTLQDRIKELEQSLKNKEFIEQLFSKDSGKLLLSTEKPVLEQSIGRGGYGEVYRGK